MIAQKKARHRFSSQVWNGILLTKLFWSTVRKNWSSEREKCLKFEAEGQEFVRLLRSLEQCVWTEKGQNNCWNRIQDILTFSKHHVHWYDTKCSSWSIV